MKLRTLGLNRTGLLGVGLGVVCVTLSGVGCKNTDAPRDPAPQVVGQTDRGPMPDPKPVPQPAPPAVVPTVVPPPSAEVFDRIHLRINDKALILPAQSRGPREYRATRPIWVNPGQALSVSWFLRDLEFGNASSVRLRVVGSAGESVFDRSLERMPLSTGQFSVMAASVAEISNVQGKGELRLEFGTGEELKTLIVPIRPRATAVVVAGWQSRAHERALEIRSRDGQVFFAHPWARVKLRNPNAEIVTLRSMQGVRTQWKRNLRSQDFVRVDPCRSEPTSSAYTTSATARVVWAKKGSRPEVMSEDQGPQVIETRIAARDSQELDAYLLSESPLATSMAPGEICGQGDPKPLPDRCQSSQRCVRQLVECKVKLRLGGHGCPNPDVAWEIIVGRRADGEWHNEASTCGQTAGCTNPDPNIYSARHLSCVEFAQEPVITPKSAIWSVGAQGIEWAPLLGSAWTLGAGGEPVEQIDPDRLGLTDELSSSGWWTVGAQPLVLDAPEADVPPRGCRLEG